MSTRHSNISIDWNNISPEDFEELCYHLLASMGFVNLEWYGQTGADRGRDIVGQKTVQLLPKTQEITRWIVQCKRYTNRSHTRTDLDTSIIWAKSHKPDYYLLITTSILNANTRDWLDSIKKDLSFQIKLIEKPQLEELIRARLDLLRPYLPEPLYRDFSIGGGVHKLESATLEELLGLRTVNIKRSLKEQIFDDVVIPKGTTFEGPVYGQTVVIEQGCCINGSIYAKREINVMSDSIIKGSVVCPGSIKIIECEVNDVIGSQIILYGPCTVHGNIITDRDTHISPHSKIANIYCSSSSLDIGEGCEVDNAFCKGVIIVGEDVTITSVLRSSDVIVNSRSTLGWVLINGNLKIPEKSTIKYLSTKGSVHIESDADVFKLHTEGDVELCIGNSLQEITCRNLLAGDAVHIEKLRSKGSITIRGINGGFQGKYIISEGNIHLPNDTNVEIICTKGDVTLGHKGYVEFLSARNLKTLDNFKCEKVRCLGTVELGQNCTVGSLQSVEDIKFMQGLRTTDWTIFSKKGDIIGEGKVQLGDTKISADEIIKYKNSSILTTLINKDQLKAIQDIKKRRGSV